MSRSLASGVFRRNIRVVSLLAWVGLAAVWGALASVHTARAEAPCRLTAREKADLLPWTRPPKNLRPLAAPGEALPDDCDFYKWAWEAFLDVTQVVDGRPRFLSLPTFQDVFKTKDSPLFADQKAGLLALAPRQSKTGVKDEPIHFGSDDFMQAATEDVLVDPNGNAIWYAIHLNKTYEAFVDDYGLRDRKKLANAPPDLTFRTGSLELKSAWRIIPDHPAQGDTKGRHAKIHNAKIDDAKIDDLKTYITARAIVPVFKTGPNGNIVRDGDKTRIVTVALLGLHVVGTIEGHPEFIWSTFEHVSHDQKVWYRDVAPAATANPTPSAPPRLDLHGGTYALYPSDKQLTAAARPDANIGNGISGLKLDARTQTFTPHASVYRLFPGSKSDDPREDDAVSALNADIQALFETRAPADVRSNYQLVGAIWLNRPEIDFQVGVDFMKAAKAPRGEPLFGGEDRLSSMVMEPFIQPSDSLPNCLACHNTEGVAGMPPSRLNVSHALSKFYALGADAGK